MIVLILAVVLAALLAVGLVLAVVKPQMAKRITVIFLLIAAIGGILIYGYGYLMVCDNWLLMILRAVPAVCAMFLGKDCFGDIEAAPLMENGWMQTLFWIIHCYAIYTTVSAVVGAVGAKVIRKLRMRFARKKPIELLYGVNERTLFLGQKLADKQAALIFVDEQTEENAKVETIGGILRMDSHALQADAVFLRGIGCTKGREIILYALQDDPSDNLRYAQALLATLKTLGVKPEKTRLVIGAQEEVSVDRLQVAGEQYGYGYVTAVHEPVLAARLLTRNYPPCRHVSFDREAKAAEDFESLIIGFGQVGQAVLKSLVMSGQFEGSTFRSAVFASDCQIADGRIHSQFESVFSNYDITLNPCDARSIKVYQHIRQRGNNLKYIVICTGNEKLNRELAEELASYCKRLHLTIPVYICSRRGVSACDADGVVVQHHALYQPELLCNHMLDRMAMLLNSRYQDPTQHSPLEAWMRCDYFSRQSCRAATDFVEAMLCAAGTTAQQLRTDGWQLTPAQLENMSKTEHLRWCAFHYCMDFKTMDEETFAKRGEEYLRQQKQTGKEAIRIGKDMENRLHACLVDWDALQQLSEKEAAYTGKLVDYKAMDTANVLAVPALLNAMEE